MLAWTLACRHSGSALDSSFHRTFLYWGPSRMSMRRDLQHPILVALIHFLMAVRLFHAKLHAFEI